MGRTVQGDASWGISSDTKVTNVDGVITDIDVGEDPQMEPQRNEIGAVIKQTLYDRRGEVNVTVEVAAGTAKPKTGTAITVAGVVCFTGSAVWWMPSCGSSSTSHAMNATSSAVRKPGRSRLSGTFSVTITLHSSSHSAG